jgi:2'-5' RNA ligase
MTTATPFGIPVDDAPGWDGAIGHMMDASGQVHAWLVEEPGDGLVGYIQGAPGTESTVRVSNPHAWADLADSLGLIEFPTDIAAEPVEDVLDEEAPDDGAPDEEAAAETPAEDDAVAEIPAEGKAKPAGRILTPSDDQEQTGIMVALMIPEGDARDMVLDLDTALPWTELHLTLAYMGKTDEVADEGEFYSKVLEALREVASDHDQIEGQVSGVGRFSIKGDADAFVYLFDSPALPEFRQALVDALDEQGIEVNKDHGFTPHITLAYLKEGEENPIRRSETKVLAFDVITFCYGEQRLNIRLGGKGADEEDEAYRYEGRVVTPESTAPSAMPDAKGKNPFGKRGGPALTAGSYVSWGNQRGKVDLVVTNGKVPGVEEDVTGTADKPAARVVVYAPGAGGKWKATPKKVAVATSSLKRTAPFMFGKKDLDLSDPEAALVGILTDYYEAHDGSAPLVDPLAVKTAYERGLQSWPGEPSGVANEAWALRARMSSPPRPRRRSPSRSPRARRSRSERSCTGLPRGAP